MADDYGASTTTVGTVTVGGSATGTIEVGADRDWFRITLIAGQSYIFNLDRGTLLDPFLVLYDQNGVDIVGNDDIVTNVNFNSQIRFTATVSGTYFLAAFSSDGADVGTYTVRAAIDPSPPVSTDDYGAQAGSPNVGTLAVGGSATGNLETINDRDWFAITLTAGGSYTFRQNSGTLADPLLRLRDGNGVVISSNDDGGGGLNSLINYTAVATGVYYLEANTADQGNAAGTGTYTVSAVVNGSPPPPPVDDFGSQVGAGNLGSVTVGASSTGLINYGGDHDWFAVTLSVGSTYRIRQEVGTLADPRFTLRNSIGVALTGDDDSGGGQNAQVDFTAPTSGVYYIDANSADGTGTGNYTVRVTLLYGAPVIATNTGSTAAEGATDIVTSSELLTTDPDSAASAIVYTLTSLATNGTLTRNGSAIALNGTFTQADINSNLVAFNHNGSETTSASFGFSVTDGTTNFTGRTFNFTVTPVNDAPTSTGLQGDSATTTEPAGSGSTMPAVKIDVGGNATIADVDNANFNGGSIRFAITTGLAAGQDQLVIDTAAATTVSLAGNVVSIGGVAIGTVSGGGAGGGDLVVTFNSANATAARVQTLVRAIDFANTGGDNPTAGARTITTTLIDGSGGAGTLAIASTVTVVATNDAPVGGMDNNSVAENGTIVGASVFGNDSDPDGPALSVGAVNGVAGSVGNQITLANGALLTMRANGTYDYNPNGQFNSLIDAATAAATGASNSQLFTSFTYTLTGGPTVTVQIQITGVASSEDRLGGSGSNDTITGTTAGDFFDVSLLPGGNDTLNGAGGNDAFYFGATLTALDSVDGGPGSNDQVGLQGNYSAGLTLGATTLVNIETLAVLPGFSYNLTSNDGNVAAGQVFNVFGGGLLAGQNITFNGSAETDGIFRMFGGLGNDTFTGGALDDGFYFGPGKWGAGDSVTGGGGTNDQLALDGNYTTTIGANADVEVLVLLGGPTASPNTFNIALADAFTPATQTRTVFATAVTTSAVIDGSAESNGILRVFGGQAADTITGGAGDDFIFGSTGGDTLRGGAGTDIFYYDAVNQSSSVNYDRLLDFSYTADRIQIAGQVHDTYSAVTGGTLSTATFDADLGTALNALLTSGNAVFFAPNAGTLAGSAFLVVDANGVDGYQAGQDYVFEVPNPPPALPPVDFIIP